MHVGYCGKFKTRYFCNEKTADFSGLGMAVPTVVWGATPALDNA